MLLPSMEREREERNLYILERSFRDREEDLHRKNEDYEITY